MSDYVDWGKIPSQAESQSSGGKRSKFLWLKSGNKYRIRPVHLPIQFTKYYRRDENKKLRTAICQNPETCTVRSSHPEDEIRASTRYAIFAFDRADGALKVMEGPVTVFRPFRSRYEATQKNPGGMEGGDWQIEVSGQGLTTKYQITYLDDKPFTAEEKQIIKDELEKNKLQQIYAPHSPEEIENRLYGELNKPENDSGSTSENSIKDDVGDLW